ncbi:histidine kinase [Cohnella cellulosilytica]|uniref:Histidine kinase n=1 Tax=Cohnella cellulosilytica TaxID=986710 RepID=A0ABW2FLN9_9BACL
MFELSGYRVTEAIESGGEFALFRVERAEDGRRLLAKTINGSEAESDGAATLYKEYERLLRLKGRGVVEPEGVEFQGTRPVLLLPDNGETTLERELRTGRGARKLEELLERAVAMADCLRQLHQAGMMLHVLAPSSFLLGASGVRLLDLRYASPIHEPDAAASWAAGRTDWALPYLSPEQTGRTGRAPDLRSDLYSLGVILYEWFTGTYPYPSGSALDLLYHHLAANPEPVWQRNASIPRMVSAVVQKCMEKMPEARYAGASGIRADLEECLLQLRVSGKVQPFPLGKRDYPLRWSSENLAAGQPSVEPYDREGLKRTLSLVLQGRTDGIDELAGILHYKTGGNPERLRALLQEILNRKWIVYEETSRMWTWDRRQIADLDDGEPAADSVRDDVSLLPEQSRGILARAAMLGNPFGLDELYSVAGLPMDRLTDSLDDAVRRMLIQPLGDGRDKYLFRNDSVRTALREGIPESERPELHREIGWMLARRTEAGADSRLFEALDHLNRAADRIVRSDRKTEWIELNVQAGEEAERQKSRDSSLAYLRRATDSLDEEDWRRNFPLCFRAFRLRAEAEFLSSRYDRAAETAQLLFDRAESDAARAQAGLMLIRCEWALNRTSRAMAFVETTLRLLDVPFRLRPGRLEWKRLELRVERKLKTAGAAALQALPAMTDSRLRSAMSALACAVEAGDAIAPRAWHFSVLTMMEMTLDHGWTPAACIGLAGYALRLEGQARQEVFLEAWGRRMLSLADEEPGLFARASALLARSAAGGSTFALGERSAMAGKAVHAALSDGQMGLANRCLLIFCRLLLQAGHPLRDVYARLLLHADHFRQENSRKHWRQAAALAGLASGLIGYRAASDPYADAGPNAGGEAAGAGRDGDRASEAYAFMTDYLTGNYSQAQAALEQAIRSEPAELPELFDPDFYGVLLWKETCGRGSRKEKAEAARQMRASLGRLREKAKRRRAPHLHRYLLAKAELASLKPDRRRADYGYERAIEKARDAGYALEAGIAAECYARYGILTGRASLAKVYLLEAYERFQGWGAAAKTGDMEEKYGKWLPVRKDAGLERVDHLSVILSAQALSSEMEMGRLLQVLMHIMLQNAGAESGALIIDRDGHWIVEAHGAMDDVRIEPIPLEEAGEAYPSDLILYSARTQEEIVVQDAAASDLFERSGDTVRRGIRSALCLPVLYRNKLIGLLYLENNLSTGVFTEERLDVLRLLASQCAIALTNARLFSGIQHLTNHLEEQVEERTRRLEQSMLATSEAQAEMKIYAERNRIAQEIHDIVGHTLTSTVLQIEAGKRLLRRDLDRSLERLNEAQGLVRHSLNEIRNSVHMLKEDKYYDLQEALQRLIQETERNAGVTIRASIDPAPSVSALHKKVIYHALQEGLTNGIRHGKCGEFRFLLRDRGSWLEFELQDDGTGTDGVEKGFGLNTMHERVRQLKGALSIDSEPSKGCLLRIQLPY